MFPFRLCLPSPPNDLTHINKEGQLVGPMKSAIEEVFIYFVRKFNLTWVPMDGNLRTNDEIQVEGVNLIAMDQADGALTALMFLSGLPKNATAASIVDDAWCKIASSPVVKSSLLINGLISALRQIRIELLVLILIDLSIMVHLAHMILRCDNLMMSIWVVFTSLVKQNTSSMLKKSFSLVYIVLVLSVLLIQILFGTFLHTERTSISSFTRIDTFNDIRRYNLTKFVLDISHCTRFVKDDPDYKAIPLVEQYLAGEDYSWCVASGKCSLLMNTLDFNILLSLSCSLYPEKAIRNPLYLSPDVCRVLGGFLLNKRMPKRQQEKINGYIQRSFEMGMEEEKDFTSKRFAIRAVKTMTQMNVDERCLSETIGAKFSSPISLSMNFFRDCFLLYLSAIIFSLILHFIVIKIQKLDD